MRAHESIYDDAYIVINEYRGEGEGRVICRASNEDTALCYEQATAELKYYAKCKEEERRHEKRTG
jgi:hypothetical protein